MPHFGFIEGRVTEDGKSVASFNEIFDQQKIATHTTEVFNRPALFVFLIDGIEGHTMG